MASDPSCKHSGGPARSFRGMRLLRVAAESVVYHCERCGSGVRVGRCHGTTNRGLRCRRPVEAMTLTCRAHRETTLVPLSDVLDPHELPRSAKPSRRARAAR